MKSILKNGHAVALFTVVIWSTTFISTKVLLRDFDPLEIQLFRFVLGFCVLLVVYPHALRLSDRKQEWYFALAGFTGVCVYYLLENIALDCTQASNVSVILSTAPFFSAVLSRLVFRDGQKLTPAFFAGFALAMAGIFLISFQGRALHFNPVGDLLSLIAAAVWACYSVTIRKIAGFGYNTIQTTRRIFAYGILFLIPMLFVFDFHLDLAPFARPVNLFNILYLGIGASALCFVTWNFAVKVLGVVKSSVYIYLSPVITVLASVAILHEEITGPAVAGIALTVSGLFVSGSKPRRQTKRESPAESDS